MRTMGSMRRGPRVIKFMVAACVLAALASAATMLLWNALLPALFGLAHIGFWQALGLLVLSRLLFGGLRGPMGGPVGMAWRQKMQERWQQMTPEQRERLRSGWGGKWAGCGPQREGDQAAE
ncbi:MAG: hypothetical protein QM718_15870 [Steroidobacteraceae bacterium]